MSGTSPHWNSTTGSPNTPSSSFAVRDQVITPAYCVAKQLRLADGAVFRGHFARLERGQQFALFAAHEGAENDQIGRFHHGLFGHVLVPLAAAADAKPPTRRPS